MRLVVPLAHTQPSPISFLLFLQLEFRCRTVTEGENMI